MRPARRALLVVVLCLAAVLAVAGCGDAGSPDEDTAEDAITTATAPVTAPGAASDAAAAGCALDPAAADVAPTGLGVIVFTRTEGFRHPSIEQAQLVLGAAGEVGDWDLTVTEDPDELVDALDEAQLLVLANTSGDVFDDDHQVAIESWVRGGGGVLAVHSATDTEYDWPFYGEVVGAWSAGHPPGLQEVDLHVEDGAHPATSSLPDPWRRLDEYYDFDRDPRDLGAHVLLSLDESTATYEPGARPFAMGDDHPVAWTIEVDDGRAFTTNLGHRPETWCEPLFQQHLLGGASWAVGADS